VSPLGPITVATLSITAVWAGGLKDRYGIRNVGAIEPGLPHVTVSGTTPLQAMGVGLSHQSLVFPSQLLHRCLGWNVLSHQF
jgi:hypothetical protein